MRGRREHELPVGIEELIEEIEQLFLGALLAGEQMDVVQEQCRRAAVARAPPVHAVSVDRRDQLIDEALRRETRDDRVLLLRQLETDGIEQVCLDRKSVV